MVLPDRRQHVAFRTAAGGPKGKDLTVARVIRNEKSENRVIVQSCRGIWQGMKVVHRLEYLRIDGTIVIEPGDARRAEQIVRYSALVALFELYVEGELTHGCARSSQMVVGDSILTSASTSSFSRI